MTLISKSHKMSRIRSTNVCLLIILLDMSMGQNSPNISYWKYFGNGCQDVYRVCDTGIAQSPINILRKNITRSKLSPLRLTYYQRPHYFRAENNGHTVMFTLDSRNERPPLISRGHLPGNYQLEQFHFHWGENDTLGSEHLLDGQRFPLEAHLVHYKTNYGNSIEEALSNKEARDGLLVLAVLFKVVKTHNVDLDPVIEILRNIVQEGDGALLTRDFSILRLLPRRNRNRIYFYKGSLTTPKCDEKVLWNIFKSANTISSNQLKEFRKLVSRGYPLMNNFRSPQPLNGREVKYFA